MAEMSNLSLLRNRPSKNDDPKEMLSDLLVNLEDFKNWQQIGAGNFGVVYRAEDHRKTPTKIVAVKKWNKPTGLKDARKIHELIGDLMNELDILARLRIWRHPALTSLIGFTLDEETGGVTMITSYMRNGSLEDMLKREREGTAPAGWNATTKSLCVFGIAVGMAYLHQHGVLHRDLKEANVLLNDDFEPCISDFGFSRIGYWDGMKMKGTPLYAAPEIFEEEWHMRADVYAYGVLLYMIFRERAQLELDDKRGPIGNDFTRFVGRILRGARYVRPESISDFYWNLITRCWNGSPEKRPSFKTIVNELRREREKYVFKGADLEKVKEYEERVVQDVDLIEKVLFSNDEIDDLLSGSSVETSVP